jgi:hypothetical protein
MQKRKHDGLPSISRADSEELLEKIEVDKLEVHDQIDKEKV